MEYIELDSESDSESNERNEIGENEGEIEEEQIVSTCCGLSWINLWFGF
tara:strand:- start:312 stop:458 length:147 start_codon:yes stop_codon:yes gene_type:complete